MRLATGGVIFDGTVTRVFMYSVTTGRGDMLPMNSGTAALVCCLVRNRDADQMKKMMIELQHAQRRLMPPPDEAALRPCRSRSESHARSAILRASITNRRSHQRDTGRSSPDAVPIWDPAENVTYSLNPKDMTAHFHNVTVCARGREQQCALRSTSRSMNSTPAAPADCRMAVGLRRNGIAASAAESGGRFSQDQA